MFCTAPAGCSWSLQTNQEQTLNKREKSDPRGEQEGRGPWETVERPRTTLGTLRAPLTVQQSPPRRETFLPRARTTPEPGPVAASQPLSDI